MKLIPILEAATKSDIQKYFFECLNKYFPEYSKKTSEWGIPKFSLRSGITEGGYYSHASFWGRGYVTDQQITVNKDLSNNESIFRSVVFHETIHYVQVNLVARKLHPYTNEKPLDYHDNFFMQMLKKINSVEGNNYIKVSEQIDDLADLKTVKPFFVYGIITKSNQYAYVWTVSSQPDLDDFFKRLITQNKYKSVFKIEVDLFWFKVAKFKYKKGSSIKFAVIEKDEILMYVKDRIQSNNLI